MRSRSRLSLGLTALALSAALTGCAGDDPADNAPDPVAVEELPTPVQTLVTSTDVGQYFGTVKEGVTEEQVQSTLAALQQNQWVQKAEQLEDGRIDLVFRGDPPAEARQEAVTQLAAIATVDEGV